LNHINWQFQGDFNVDQFEHWAFYNPVQNQIEMHLRSLEAQTAKLEALNFQVALDKGETIHTEISRKFHLPTLMETLEAYALKPLETWTDPNAWFGLVLCQRQCIGAECP
jgi:uncharacterized SAM-dependent methyltransferase